jgi:hypothetical protein
MEILIFAVAPIVALLLAAAGIARLIAGPKPKVIDPREEEWWQAIK